jgi:hypothetical protein
VARFRPNSRWLGVWETTLDENVGPEEILARYNRNY